MAPATGFIMGAKMKLKTLNEFIAVDLRDDLRNPDFALGYLQACFDEAKVSGNPDVFFAAVQDVARANEEREYEPERDTKSPPRFATKSNHRESKELALA